MRLLPLSYPFRFLLFALLTAHIGRGAPTREVAIAPPAAWIETLALPHTSATPETSVGRHYLLFETQTNVSARATYNHYGYRILNDAGLRNGSQINLSFDPGYEALTLHHVRLRRGEEVLDRLDRTKIQVLQRESDLEYLIYNGELSAVIILDDVRVGDIVEVAYTKTGVNPVFGNLYIDALSVDWGLPVEHLRLRVVHPGDRKITYRNIGPSALTPRESDTPAGHELIWEARDLPAKVYDRKIPSWHRTTTYVQLTEFPSWRAVVEWALPLYAESDPAAAAIREKAAALKAAASTPAERALGALRFVQEEVRYLGLEQGAGSHRPSPPETVFVRRFGDCKDKSRLLVSLLRQMGLKAAPVLVHSTARHTLADRLPSPLAFNHAIVTVQIEGTDYVLDPTLNDQRGGLPQRHTARYYSGLVIEPETTGLTIWPPSPNDESRTHVEETFTVSGLEAGTTLHVRSTYSARSAERIRAELADTNRDDLAKSYVDFYARYYPEISTARPVSWRDDEATNTLVVDEHYTLPRVFVREPDNPVLKAEFYATAFNDYTGSPGAGGRTAPLAIHHPVDITSRTRVLLHETWPITPAKMEVTDSAFVFKHGTAGTGREVEWTYHWRSTADHVTLENFATHSRNLTRVKDALGNQLTYNTAATENSPFSMNWMLFLLAGVTLASSSYGARWLWRDRDSGMPPPLPGNSIDPGGPSGLGGWLILVGIGVVSRPITLLVYLVTSFEGDYNLDTWRTLTTPGHASFQPSFAVIASTELVLNHIMLIVSLLLLGLFFGCRRSFPRVMIGLLLLELFSALFDLWGYHALTNVTPAERTTAFTNLIRSATVAAIWIPYFCISRRVKATFTR